jgi:hypothetical protein
MIYNPITEIIHGVTHSCYKNMGIPSSLVSGNISSTAELTMNQIAPEIMDPKNKADLTSSNGLIISIDTTTI